MRVWGLLQKDCRIAWRNGIVLIEVIIAVLMALLYHFALPDAFDMEPAVFAAGDEALLSRWGEQSGENVTLLSSREAVTEAMVRTPSSYGVIATLEGSKPAVELLFHGYESPQVVNTAVLAMESADPTWQVTTDVRVQTIRDQPLTEKLSFRTTVLAAMLLMEPALLGLFFAATLIFSEKEEGSARAYSVTRGGTGRYLLSKILVLILLSALSSALMTGLTAPGGVRWGWMLGIVLAGSAMGSALALLIASFFDRLSAAMMPLSLLIVVLTLPLAALFAPAFSPGWMRLLPTWHQIFALRECFYDTGRAGIFGWGILYPLAVAVAALIPAGLQFNRRLKD